MYTVVQILQDFGLSNSNSLTILQKETPVIVFSLLYNIRKASCTKKKPKYGKILPRRSKSGVKQMRKQYGKRNSHAFNFLLHDR